MRLETIGPNEQGFRIPDTGDARTPTSTDDEEFPRANLVETGQVRMPQQWIPLGSMPAGPVVETARK